MEALAYEQELHIQSRQLEDARMVLEQRVAQLVLEHDARMSLSAAITRSHFQLAEEREEVVALREAAAEEHCKQEIGEPLEKPLIKGIRENH